MELASAHVHMHGRMHEHMSTAIRDMLNSSGLADAARERGYSQGYIIILHICIACANVSYVYS